MDFLRPENLLRFGYKECVLCDVERKGEEKRCDRCSGRIGQRDRLLWEINRERRRRIAGHLALVYPGLGHFYSGRVWYVEVLAGGASKDNQNLMALLGLGAQVGVILPFSRTQESEADLMGLDLMAKAGFDPRASVVLWKNMAAAGGSGGPVFISTHPASGTRIKDLENRMPKAMPVYEQARAQGKAPRCQ